MTKNTKHKREEGILLRCGLWTRCQGGGETREEKPGEKDQDREGVDRGEGNKKQDMQENRNPRTKWTIKTQGKGDKGKGPFLYLCP
jgi:hypothetical protein